MLNHIVCKYHFFYLIMSNFKSLKRLFFLFSSKFFYHKWLKLILHFFKKHECCSKNIKFAFVPNLLFAKTLLLNLRNDIHQILLFSKNIFLKQNSTAAISTRLLGSKMKIAGLALCKIQFWPASFPDLPPNCVWTT